MESPRDQELISTLTLVQRLLWWSKSAIQLSAEFFLSYLSNGDESEEKDHGNEFIGSKNGGKEVWVGLKCSKNTKIRRPKVAAAAAFAGPIRARPTAVGREILRPRSSGGGAPPCRGGRNKLPRLKPDRPKNGLKRPNSGFFGFWGFSLEFGVGS